MINMKPIKRTNTIFSKGSSVLIKKIFYAIVSVAMLLTVISLFCKTPDRELTAVRTITEDNIRQTVIEKNERYRFSQNKLAFSNVKEDFNTIHVKFKERISEHETYRLYLIDPETGASEQVSSGTVVDRGYGLLFSLKEGTSGLYELKSNQDIITKEFSLINTKDVGVSLKFNTTALIVLSLIAGVLAIAEKKLGYFGWLLSIFKKNRDALLELKASNKAHFSLTVSAFSVTALFVVGTIVLLSISHYSEASIITVFAVACVALVLQIVSRLVTKRNCSPAELFLVAALVFGFMMCYTAPVTTHASWDDEIHFQYAFKGASPHMSDYSLALHKLFTRNYKVADFISSPNSFIDTMTRETAFFIEDGFPRNFIYNAYSYSPFIASILFSNLLGSDLATLLTSARIVGMLAYAFIVYFGIKKLRSGAYVFSAVCLLPSTLFLSCSLGYDLWLTAWFTYGFASLISMFQQPDRKITSKDYLKALGALFIGCAAKSVYFFMMLPMLFIPKNKFVSEKHSKRLKLVSVGVMALIVVFIFAAGVYSDSRGGTNVSATHQLVYVLTHPFNYAVTLVTHILSYCSVPSFVGYSSVFGFLAGYKESPFVFLGIFSLLILIFAVIADRNQCNSNNPIDLKNMQVLRWSTVAATVIQVAVISTVMYLCFTNIGENYINGCQYRYLFPLMAPFCFLITPRLFKIKINETVKKSIIFGCLSVNLIVGYLISYIIKLI